MDWGFWHFPQQISILRFLIPTQVLKSQVVIYTALPLTQQTLPDPVTQKHNVQFVSLPPALIPCSQPALWHCTHSTLIPLSQRKDWKCLKAFKWEQLRRKQDKIQGMVSCSHGKNPCNMDIPEVALNYQPSVTVTVQSSAAAYCKIRAVSVWMLLAPWMLMLVCPECRKRSSLKEKNIWIWKRNIQYVEVWVIHFKQAEV